MKFHTVLLDMDGVLVDFIGGVLHLFGSDKRDTDVKTWDGIIEVVGAKDPTTFWNKIASSTEFWEHLRGYPWYRTVVDLLEAKGVRLYLSTSPTRDPNCAKGKTAWVAKHFPKLRSNLMIGKHKYLMAKEGVLLIDDSTKNNALFTAHGGAAILFPQPWNCSNLTDEPWDRFYRFVEDFAGAK